MTRSIAALVISALPLSLSLAGQAVSRPPPPAPPPVNGPVTAVTEL